MNRAERLNEREAAVNSLMAHGAVIVADSGKIGRTAFATLGDLANFSTLITDAGTAPEPVVAFTDRGLEVVVAA